jgi:hypothetical protein
MTCSPGPTNSKPSKSSAHCTRTVRTDDLV